MASCIFHAGGVKAGGGSRRPFQIQLPPFRRRSLPRLQAPLLAAGEQPSADGRREAGAIMFITAYGKPGAAFDAQSPPAKFVLKEESTCLL
jgi:hypothetical protein